MSANREMNTRFGHLTAGTYGIFGIILYVASVLISLCFADQASASERIGGVVMMSMISCCQSEAWPEAEERILSELRLDNIPVIKIDSEATNRQARLDEMRRVAESHGATAVIRISRRSDEADVVIDLWLVESTTDRAGFRRLEIDPGTSAASTLDVAIRTVEALRATIVESQFTETREKEMATPVAAVASSFPRFGIGAAGAVETTPNGDIGARGAFSIYAIIEPIKNLDLELGFLVSPLGKELETENATSTLDYLILQALVYYRFTNKTILAPAIGIGGGSLLVWGQGRTEKGKLLMHDKDQVPFVGGGVRLVFQVNQVFFITIGSFAGVTFPEVKATHGGKTAAHLGRPLFDGSIGVQLRFQ
jgi:hypothetical protein